MSAQDIAIIIGSITVGLSSIIGAFFAGLIALRQLPKAAQRREELAAGEPPKDG